MKISEKIGEVDHVSKRAVCKNTLSKMLIKIKIHRRPACGLLTSYGSREYSVTNLIRLVDCVLARLAAKGQAPSNTVFLPVWFC
jgi:hypothetical protein